MYGCERIRRWMSTASSWAKPNTKAWVDRTSWSLVSAATIATAVNSAAAAISISRLVSAPKAASVAPIKRELARPLGIGEHGEEGHDRRDGRQFGDCARQHQREQARRTAGGGPGSCARTAASWPARTSRRFRRPMARSCCSAASRTTRRHSSQAAEAVIARLTKRPFRTRG